MVYLGISFAFLPLCSDFRACSSNCSHQGACLAEHVIQNILLFAPTRLKMILDILCMDAALIYRLCYDLTAKRKLNRAYFGSIIVFSRNILKVYVPITYGFFHQSGVFDMR